MAKRKKKGLFITFEGIDGCGKTTQLNRTYDYLHSMGYNLLKLREPGSTPAAERIRRLLLDPKMEISDLSELLLYEAARSEVTRREIVPALKAGKIVLCDRFYDSTTAYQGYGRGLDLRMVRSLHRIATGGVRPNLTLVFDLTLKRATERLGPKRDRLEGQPRSFHRRVRQGFLEIADRESRRVKVVDGSLAPDEVFSRVRVHIDRRLRRL